MKMSCLILSLAIMLGLQSSDGQAQNMKVVMDGNVRADLGDGRLRLALSPDGGAVFVGSDKDTQIREYHTATRKLTRRLDATIKDVRCLAVSPDGTMLAVGGDGLIVYALKDWKMLLYHERLNRVDSVAFSCDSKALAFGTVDNSVRVLNLPDGRRVRSLVGFRGPVMCVSFSPDDSKIVAGGIDQAVRIWDLKNGDEKSKIVNSLSITSALAFSSDGKYLAFSSVRPIGPIVDPLKTGAPNEVKVWDLKGNKLDSTITGNMTEINTLFVSHDAQHVIAVSENGRALVWQRDQGKAGYSPIWEREQCRALAVSRNCNKMATVNKDGALTFWELRFSESK